MFLINEAELLPRARHADVKQPPRFSKSSVCLLVAPVRDIVGIDAEHNHCIELSALGAVERAERDASRALDPARENVERHVLIARGVSPGHHFCTKVPLLVRVSGQSPPRPDQFTAQSA